MQFNSSTFLGFYLLVFTVYWLMGHAGDRFACMISHCGVFNLESMYLSTEEQFFVDWDLGGPFWRSEEVAVDYRRFSPHRPHSRRRASRLTSSERRRKSSMKATASPSLPRRTGHGCVLSFSSWKAWPRTRGSGSPQPRTVMRVWE